MTARVSARGTARRVEQANQKQGRSTKKKTGDSFQNFVANLGIGTDNLTSASTYGFNPVTRNRILLEWIHRGSWLGGMAVDVVADDMTREGVELKGLEPDQADEINEAATSLGLWPQINDTVRGARLYGGAILVPLIEGQDMSSPLRIETIGSGQLKGFLALDRWMCEPSLEDLVSDFGPHLGMPKFYRVTSDAPGLRGQRIHYTRVLRMEGDHLPYWQRVVENLWGTSVFERLYDRMVAFDSATTGASQLVYKAWLRALKIKGLREIIANGGKKLEGLVKYTDMFRRFQSIEGTSLIDGEDDYSETGSNSFGGLAEVLLQLGQQISGALQIPLVRLFGQSPAGLNSTGESDLKTYYDGILQRQELNLRVMVTKMYRCMAQSLGIVLPKGFTIEFRPLWQLSENDKADVAEKITRAIIAAVEAGLCDVETGAKELAKSAEVTGIYTNLDEKKIEELATLPPPTAEVPGNMPGGSGAPGMGSTTPITDATLRQLTQDHSSLTSELARRYGLQIVIENPKGSIRQGMADGKSWSVRMPAHYGYFRSTTGADGDQTDCYVGDDATSQKVFVVHQNHPDTGRYDEDKVMLGFPNRSAAMATYLAGHSRGLEAFGSMEEVPIKRLYDHLGAALPCPACETGDCLSHGTSLKRAA